MRCSLGGELILTSIALVAYVVTTWLSRKEGNSFNIYRNTGKCQNEWEKNDQEGWIKQVKKKAKNYPYMRLSPNALLSALPNELVRKIMHVNEGISNQSLNYITSAADCNCFLISSTSKIRWGCSCREEHLCCHGTGKTDSTRSPKAHELSREISASDRFPSLRFRKKWTFNRAQRNGHRNEDRISKITKIQFNEIYIIKEGKKT